MEIPGLSLIPILFVVLIIVPGVFAKRFYFSGVFSKQFGAGDFGDRLITSIFWGFIVQIITYLVYSRYFDFTLLDIKEYLVAAYTDLSSNKLPRDFEKYNLWMVLGYIIASVVMSAIVGTVGYRLIRLFKIDIKFSTFRYSNDWHYYFSGEILRTKLFKSKGRILSTSADILVSTGEAKPKMISGILSQYTLSKSGELETIILTAARRYSETSKAFKDIPGDFIIIPYNKVVDLNIRYEYPAQGSKSKFREIVESLFGAVIIISFVSILILPWFLGYSFITTIVGIFWLLAVWAFGIMNLAFFIDNKSKLTFWPRFWSIVFLAMSGYLSYDTLQLGKVWGIIKYHIIQYIN